MSELLGDPGMLPGQYGCERPGAGMGAAPLPRGLSGKLGPAIPARNAQPGHVTYPTRSKRWGYKGQTWDIPFAGETPLPSHTHCLPPSRDNPEVLRRLSRRHGSAAAWSPRFIYFQAYFTRVKTAAEVTAESQGWGRAAELQAAAPGAPQHPAPIAGGVCPRETHTGHRRWPRARAATCCLNC